MITIPIIIFLKGSVPRCLSQNLFDVVYNDKQALMLATKRQFCNSALFIIWKALPIERLRIQIFMYG